jgi:large subunit ribosomal protein L17
VRHEVFGKKLGRTKNQRTSLFRGLIRSLFLHGAIVTTEAKSKAIKGLVDKLIVRAKDKSEASKNVIIKILPQKEISEKLIKEIAPQYKTRNSGFAQVTRLGVRKGDGAMMVRMNLIDYVPAEKKEELSNAKAMEGKEENKIEKVESKKDIKIEKPKVKKVVKKEEVAKKKGTKR